jgi:hypothetical protein
MNRKEWREVGGQCLYFVLALAAMALLLEGVDLLMGVMGFVQSKPLEGEKLIIILGAWLLMFSMFLGLSPFAMDSKQKGMEYLLTLPYSRRRLLIIKLRPRLAAVVLFYLSFILLYVSAGNGAIAGGFTLFSLAYFALFFISFSLAVVDENFIVQSIWAGIALSVYIAICLYTISLGFSWKFGMPSSWVGSSLWHDLSFDSPTLMVSIAVFLIMAAPFIVSFFLAFKKFDLKPARAFNRRHLLTFVPLLLLAFAASLGITYLVQNSTAYDEADFHILRDRRLLKTSFAGKLTLYSETGRQRIKTRGLISWESLLLEQKERLFLSGYDSKDGTQFIGRLNLADLSWKILHRCPTRYFVVPGYQGFRYDGESFVYLRRSRAEAERPGLDIDPVVRSEEMELVRVDPASGKDRTIACKTPLFKRYYEPTFIGCDVLKGSRFWLVAHKWSHVLRLWEDGRVEDLGLSKGIPVYVGGLLFTRGDNSIKVLRLLASGSETVKEIGGDFKVNAFLLQSLAIGNAREIYVERNKRIVRIDLATLAVDDVAPDRGHIWITSSGEFYYVEFETWPGKADDQWKKLYRLQGGKRVFLKQFDFHDDGYGHIFVDTFGVILRQVKMKNSTVSRTRTRAFAFPDLRELGFKGLN